MTRTLDPETALVARFAVDLDRLVEPGEKIGVAVSGGPDSLALLLLAAAARPGLIEAASVDHGLRPEGRGEAEMVAALSARIGVPHAILEIDGLEDRGGNLQAQAREARYELLGQWAVQHGLAAVATAHHLDDQAETVLMRVARGSGVGGLAAVQPSRLLTCGARLVRPLLRWHRYELQRIVEDAGLEPVRDPSNEDMRFDRTRARDLLASVDWLDPERLARVAANAADADEALDWAAGQAFERCATRDGEVLTLDPHDLPRELRRRLLVRAIAELGGEEPPGPQLMTAIDSLDTGDVTTLAGLKLEGGPRWRLSPAPPRKAPPFTP